MTERRKPPNGSDSELAMRLVVGYKARALGNEELRQGSRSFPEN